MILNIFMDGGSTEYTTTAGYHSISTPMGPVVTPITLQEELSRAYTRIDKLEKKMEKIMRELFPEDCI